MKGEYNTQMKVRFSDCDPIGHLNNVKYLEYMMNAREDHVTENYGFTYEEIIRKYGCTWIAVQNQLAYLKEVRPNKIVNISSKVIEISERTTVVELLMKDAKNEVIHAALWVTAIFFDMKLRRAAPHTPEVIQLLDGQLVEIPEKSFEERVKNLRKENKQWKKF